MRRGFTLIELSIVLVIIGLIAGGVLVGQDLIEAAKIRSTISQIDKYKIATQTFDLKYDCLPGDCKNAAQFGFLPRGNAGGDGDGNGVMEGNWGGHVGNRRGVLQNGENTAFWVDLSTAKLISEAFDVASLTAPFGDFDSSNLHTVLPRSKLADDIYIYVHSESATGKDGVNSFAISGATGLFASGYIMGLGGLSTATTLKVAAAYQIDTKIDDGMPLTGNIYARYPITGPTPPYSTWSGTATSSVAVAASASTCYDNNNNTSNPVQYSMSINSGSGKNCALTLRW